MRSAHTRKLGAHIKFSLKNVFAYISYILNIDECWKNVAHRKFFAHTDFKKLEGTLLVTK